MVTKLTHAPLIFIVGETASGKTALSIKIAQQISGEIICADSRTVYKQMDIGTAKPSVKERGAVRHHLIDVVYPNEKFNAAKFKRLAEICIQDIQSRSNIPVVVGGTGLYIDSLLYNFQFNDKPDDTQRQLLEKMSIDDLTTLMNTKNIRRAGMNTKNKRHLIRALETGGQTPRNKKVRSGALIIGIKLERDVLRQRVQNRVEQMFKDGFLDEVKRLAVLFGWENEAMSGIGYRVAREYIEERATKEDAIHAFVKRDMSLAKRQRTWFKRNKNIVWSDDPSELAVKAIEFVESMHYNK